MLKKANINWNAKQLVKMMDNCTVSFENAVQRGYVWDDKRKSLLIHSMIEGYPIPAFFAAKNTETKVYDMLDGKQRSNAISDFVHGKLVLKDIPMVIDDNENEIDINGKVFDELPEDIQDAILSCSLTIYYFEDITDEQITEMFFRLNNGKPLSAIEITRVKAKSIETIKLLAAHEIFTSALTESAMNRYTNEDIVIKTWIMLHEDKPCWDTKKVRPITENAEFTETDITNITSCFNTILECYQIINNSDDNKHKKIAKRILTRTHLISMIPLINRIKDNTSTEVIVNWMIHFFNGVKSPTINKSYNDNSSSGSGHEIQISNRLKAIEEDYQKFITQSNDDNVQ